MPTLLQVLERLRRPELGVGRVLSVLGQGALRVEFRGQVLDGVVATDEPIAAGSFVWVQRKEGGGAVVHGRVK